MLTRPRHLAVILLLLLSCSAGAADDLATNFTAPPPSARPWVYWFWCNGNVTKAGITADLKAMQRVGIGGVLIMDVLQKEGPATGPLIYMSDEWRELFRFAVNEASRLGLEVNMTNGPGWCGSSGPWITPELSMQKLIVSRTTITGGQRADTQLPQASNPPPKTDGYDSTLSPNTFYRDVA